MHVWLKGSLVLVAMLQWGRFLFLTVSHLYWLRFGEIVLYISHKRYDPPK